KTRTATETAMHPASTSAAPRRSAYRPARSSLYRAVTSALLSGLSAAAAAQDSYREPGDIGDPASWATDECQTDCGLAAINALHAYARGLSGAGIKRGVLDSGAMADHPEFAGSGRLHSIDVEFEYTNITLAASGTMTTLLFGDHG